LLYVAGLALMVVGAIPGDNINAAIVFIALYTIAVGTGGIKPNVCTLGADQFDESIPQDVKEKESYFSWYVYVRML
jgi:peptide/histidine transporter 3/4